MGSKSDVPWGTGTIRWALDATLNDSDKTYTVPAKKIWALRAVYAVLTTTAVAGNRNVYVDVGNGASVVWTARAAAVQAASGTSSYAFIDSQPNTASVYNAQTQTHALPSGCLLPAGYTIRVWDAAAVDAAADDLTVVLHYVEYDA